MVTATMTSKGQITIPKAVRESLRLYTEDRISFVVHGHDEAVLRPVTRSVEDVFGILSKKNGPVRSVDQMNKAIATRMKEQTS